jgi:hypothetical protein
MFDLPWGRQYQTKLFKELELQIVQLLGIQAAQHAVIGLLLAQMEKETRQRVIDEIKTVLGMPYQANPSWMINTQLLKTHNDALSGALLAFIAGAEGRSSIEPAPQ